MTGLLAGALWLGASSAALAAEDFSEVAELLASLGGPNQQLGYSVAVSGATIIVGATFAEDFRGAVYVFERPAGGWTGVLHESAELVASDGAPGDEFGASVAISGGTIVVGAPGKGIIGFSNGGAYVFTEPSGGWSGTLTEDAALIASDTQIFNDFGNSVAISGTLVAVGASRHDHFPGDSDYDTGSVYVFPEPAGGWSGTLTEDAELVASDATNGDELGYSVALSGTTVLAGAPHTLAVPASPGTAYVFAEPPGGWTGVLSESAKLEASDGHPADLFGSSAGAAGSTLVISAPSTPFHGPPGTAYVFTEPAGGWVGLLHESARLRPSESAIGDQFGLYVAVSGSTIVVGKATPDQMVYLYARPSAGWTGTLSEISSIARLPFFRSLAFSGETVVLGAPDGRQGSESGAAFVYEPRAELLTIPALDGRGVLLLSTALACAALAMLRR